MKNLLSVVLLLCVVGTQCQERNCEINLYNEKEGYGICDRKMVEVSSSNRAGAAVLDRARTVASALQETAYNEQDESVGDRRSVDAVSASVGRTFASLPTADLSASLTRRINPGFVSWCPESCFSYLPGSMYDGSQWWNVCQLGDCGIHQPVTRCWCQNKYCSGNYAYSSWQWKGRCVQEVAYVKLLVYNKFVCTWRRFRVDKGCCCAPYKFNTFISNVGLTPVSGVRPVVVS